MYRIVMWFTEQHSTRILGLGLHQTIQHEKLLVHTIPKSGHETMVKFKQNFNGCSCITNIFRL